MSGVTSEVEQDAGAADVAPPSVPPPPAVTSWLREKVTTALREKATLPIDLLTLNFETGTTQKDLRKATNDVILVM